MKRSGIILSIMILLVFSKDSTAQNRDTLRLKKVEKLALELINNYRVSKGEKIMTRTEGLYEAAKHHAYFNTQVKKITHDEDEDISDFEELYSVSDRVERYAPVSLRGCGELVFSAGIFDYKTNSDQIDLANYIFQGWVNSPKHNRALYNGDYKFCGLSVIVKQPYYLIAVLVVSTH